MSIHRGRSWAKKIVLRSSKSGQTHNLRGQQFSFNIAVAPLAPRLLVLTTENGGLTVVSETVAGIEQTKLRLSLTSAQTAILPAGENGSAGSVVGDLVWVNNDNRHVCRITFPVKEPV